MAGKISIIITVLNEIDTIGFLVESLKQQTILPERVVIVDGGSSDGSWIMLQKLALKWPKVLKVYQKNGNRSVGRNFGVSKSNSPILGFTDAGCIPDPAWVDHLLRPFRQKETQVVSGYYYGKPVSNFQKSLIPYVLVMPDKAVFTEFYPATRSMALRRKVWQNSGGFNEGLFHNEDYAFAHKLKQLGYRFVFAPEARVAWIPRQDLRQAAWMFTRFAIGDIQAGILRTQVKLLAIRYWIFFFIFFIALELPWFFALLVPTCFAYLIWAILKNYKYVRHYSALYWLPILQITADICVLFGSLVGLLSRYYLAPIPSKRV